MKGLSRRWGCDDGADEGAVVIPICGYPECYSEAHAGVGWRDGVEIQAHEFRTRMGAGEDGLSVRPACERHLSEAKERGAMTFVMPEPLPIGYASFGSVPEPRKNGEA